MATSVFLKNTLPPLLQWKSGFIREVASLEEDNLIIFYYVYLKAGLIRGVAFHESGLIRGVVFGDSGLIRGVAFGDSGLIRGWPLVDWCLTSSEQFFSYIQDERKILNATGLETRKGGGLWWDWPYKRGTTVITKIVGMEPPPQSKDPISEGIDIIG